MSFGRRLWLVPCLFAVSTLAGCAQRGSLLSQRTSTGTLKTSLSHLEYENQQLRREAASLKAENRQIEDRLVQEESANGELTAMLDDARALLRNRSLAGGDDPEAGRVDPGPASPRTTLPAGRSTRKKRKPPFAQIPGRIDNLPSVEDDPEPPEGWGTPGTRGGGDPGPQTRLDNPALWLPVARGASEPTRPRR